MRGLSLIYCYLVNMITDDYTYTDLLESHNETVLYVLCKCNIVEDVHVRQRPALTAVDCVCTAGKINTYIASLPTHYIRMSVSVTRIEFGIINK